MRPILSATNTYNCHLAKWLEEKLKLLSTNQFTVNDAFNCTEELRSLSVNEDDILVSYDVSSLFMSHLKRQLTSLLTKLLQMIGLI